MARAITSRSPRWESIAGNFSWRGVETPALLEREYHSADDTIAANISLERLTVSMEIQGSAALALARA